MASSGVILPDAFTADERDAFLRNDFYAFAQHMFPLVSSGRTLEPAPYLDLISSTLGEVVDGTIQNLIITVPPRHLKSILASVMLPAFFMGHNPGTEVMAVSYGLELAVGFGRQTHKVLASRQFKALFETRLASKREPAHATKTIQGGVRRATSIDGVSTGIGADLLIFDDPQKPGETLSDTVRQATNAALENTFLSRRNHPSKSRMVVVMQRLHPDDFVGHAISRDLGWRVLDLAAIAEEDEAIAYGTILGSHTYRRRAGEALSPRRMPAAELARIRDAVGEAIWAAQYQQQPAPAGGGLIKLEWLLDYDPADLPAKFDRVVQSWDTANKVEQHHDYSVCTTWGEHERKYYLLHVFRERLLYPDLKAQVLELAKRWNADRVVIEDRASGTQLLQELAGMSFYKAEAWQPDRDKAMRMTNQTGIMQSGAVLIPREAPWRAELLHELMMFPQGRHDDQVDSISQALSFLAAPSSFNNIIGFYKLAASEQAGGAKGEEIWTLHHPTHNPCYGRDGNEYRADGAQHFRVKAQDAQILLQQSGWIRVDEPA